MYDPYLARRHATFLAGEPSLSAGDYATLSNSLNRILSTLGLRRRSRDVTPDPAAYMRLKAAERARAAEAQAA